MNNWKDAVKAFVVVTIIIVIGGVGAYCSYTSASVSAEEAVMKYCRDQGLTKVVIGTPTPAPFESRGNSCYYDVSAMNRNGTSVCIRVHYSTWRGAWEK